MTEDAYEERMCDFCNYEVVGSDAAERLPLNEIPEESWRQHTPAQVCDFCYTSLASSAWLSGASGDYILSRDLATFMNMLREEIRTTSDNEPDPGGD